MKTLRILVAVAACMLANKAYAIDHATASIFSSTTAASYNEINNYESLSAYTRAGYLGNRCNQVGCCRHEASCCDSIWAGFCGERHRHCCKPWFQIKCNSCCMKNLFHRCCKPAACGCEEKVESPSCDCNHVKASYGCNSCGGHLKKMFQNAHGRMHCFMHRCKSLCSSCDSCSDCGETVVEGAPVPAKKDSKKVAPPKPELDKSVKTIELFPKLSALHLFKK